MKTKAKILISLLLLSAFTANAADIVLLSPLPDSEGFFAKIARCKLSISCYRQPSLGATITTIAATDLIKDSRATINTNFTNLNNDKIEVSTTTLPFLTTLSNLVTVGALTSGSLGSGFTTVVVGRGGTGSTTLSANQVLLGSSTNAINVVSGYGTSGQFLTSNGSGAAPTWTTSSVDLGIRYDWTGIHNFVGSNVYIKNFNASSTLTINGNALVFPSAVGASSTMLQTDGSGGLTWNPESIGLFVSSSTPIATTTMSFTGITSSTELELKINVTSLQADIFQLIFNDDTGTNYAHDVDTDYGTSFTAQSQVRLALLPTSTSTSQYFHVKIHNEATRAKVISWTGVIDYGTPAGYAGTSVRGSGVWNNTSAQITSIRLRVTAGATMGAGTSIRITGTKD